MSILEVRGVSKAFGGIQAPNTCSISEAIASGMPTEVRNNPAVLEAYLGD